MKVGHTTRARESAHTHDATHTLLLLLRERERERERLLERESVENELLTVRVIQRKRLETR